MTERVACNLCGSLAADLVGVFQDIDFGLPGEFPYVRCRNCGLIYLQERPTAAEIGAYYPPAYQPFRPAIQDEGSALMRFARRRNVNQHCQAVNQAWGKPVGRLLDVGCSTGIFLDAMRQYGWQVQGVEISPQAAEYARQRLGLDVHTGQLQDARLPGASFEAITLWNVFEHLFDPAATLAEIRRLLLPGGVLVMVFPSWESLDRRLFGHSWVGYDAPRHLYAYPRPVYQRYLREHGFEILRQGCGPVPYYATLASLDAWLKEHVRHSRLRAWILKAAYFPGLRFVFSPWLALLGILGLGPTTLVVARKLDLEG